MLLNTKKEKKVFLVSKKVLNFLTEPIQLYEDKPISFSKCHSCPFYNKKDKFAVTYCENYCDKNYNTVISVPKFKEYHFTLKRPCSIVNVYSKGDMKKSIRLKKLTKRKNTYATPLQSKLMLFYFKLANSKGIVNLVPKKFLATFIKCTTKSIDNCNRILEKYGLIRYQINHKNEITVIINNFQHQHIEEGSGYVVMASNLFESILNISGLHQMRIALKAILLFDGNNHFGNKTSFSIERLKSFLPSYKQKKYKLKSFIKNILSSFVKGIKANVDMNTGIKFDIDEDFNGKRLREKLIREYEKSFKENLKENHTLVPKLEEKSKALSNLSLEYDFHKVLHIASKAPSDIVIDDVKTFASYIRYYAEKWEQSRKIFFGIN